MRIHPQAIIDPTATIADDVTIGPFSVIGAEVDIGPGSWIGPHVVISGPTSIGRDNKIYQFASIGDAPQDKKYDGEPTRLEIGDRNVIREYCTISRGTEDTGITRIGNDNTIFANSATLAGHVIVEDFAILGGFTLVHQFCKVGEHCFTAMNSVISKDVPPYIMVSGHMASPHGLNVEGLKRRGFSADALNTLRKAYKILYRSGKTLEQAITEIGELSPDLDEIQRFKQFLQNVTRGIVR